MGTKARSIQKINGEKDTLKAGVDSSLVNSTAPPHQPGADGGRWKEVDSSLVNSTTPAIVQSPPTVSESFEQELTSQIRLPLFYRPLPALAQRARLRLLHHLPLG
jgi:hypothetical protein